MFQHDTMHVGKTLVSNGSRKVQAVRFLVVGVAYGPELLDRVVWDAVDSGRGPMGLVKTPEQAADAFGKAVGGGRYAAVVVLAVGDGPSEDWADKADRSPAFVTVVEFWADARLCDGGPVLTFPGATLLYPFALTLSFRADINPTETPNAS